MPSEADIEVVSRLDLPSLLGTEKPHLMVSSLIARLQQAEEETDEAARELCQVLACASILHLRAEERHEPFGPVSEYDNNLLTQDGRLLPRAAQLLSLVLEQVHVPSLQARAADLLWTFQHPRNYRDGQAAVAAYRNLGSEIDRDWLQGVEALVRAQNLAKSLGRRAPEIQQVTADIEVHLHNPVFGDTWAASRLMELLLENGVGDAATYAALAASYAQQAEARQEWHLAHRYWLNASDWIRANGDPEESDRMRIRAAETRVKDAEEALTRPRQNLYASAWIETAIHELRAIPETATRVRELQHRLIDVQEQSTEEFGRISIPLGSDEVVARQKKTETYLSGAELPEALRRFGSIVTEARVGWLRQEAEEQLATPTLASMLTTKYVNAAGRTVASSAETQEGRITEKMCQIQSVRHQISSFIMLDAGRRFLLRTFNPSRYDLEPLVIGNPFVPAGHHHAILSGLLIGLNGDFVVASHVLVPQLEAVIRHIVELCGGLTSKVTLQNHDAIDLNRLLTEQEFTDLMENVVGPDFLFELTRLLIQRYGANMRNELAHGLMLDGTIQYHGLLAWHAMWRLLCLPGTIAHEEA